MPDSPQVVDMAARVSRQFGRRWPGDAITEANRKKPVADQQYWIGMVRAVLREAFAIAPLDNPAMKAGMKAANAWVPERSLPPHFHRPALAATAIAAFQSEWKKDLGL